MFRKPENKKPPRAFLFWTALLPEVFSCYDTAMGEETFRNKITWITFVLSILVILTHSLNAELFLGMQGAGGMEAQVESFFGDKIAQIAVPGFFMVSSFLFFQNYDPAKTGEKWKRRIHSVLIPYFLWNALYYFGYVAASRIPFLTDMVGKGIVVLSPENFLYALLSGTYNAAFWFVYQLIFLIIISPLIYFLIRKKTGWIIAEGIILFLIAFRADLFPVNGDAMFYYVSAAGMAIHRKDPVREGIPEKACSRAGKNAGSGKITENENHAGTGKPMESEKNAYAAENTESEKNRRSGEPAAVVKPANLAAAFLLAAAASVLYVLYIHFVNPVFVVLCRLFGAAALWYLLSGISLSPAKKFMRNSFMIYAMHFALVRMINKTADLFFHGSGPAALLLYFLMPVIVIAAVALIADFGRKYTPKLYAVLSGNR